MNRTRTIMAGVVFLITWVWWGCGAGPGNAGSVWPSVVAVGLAFVTRNIYLALFLGAWSGAVLLREGNPFQAFLDLFSRHLIPALSDPWNASVLGFTLMMGGLVEVLNRNGGMAAMAERLLGRTRDARRGALGVYGMGWLIFFDGLANAMLVGKTLRPLADRCGLSRAKLAFLIDSTSSPIAGVALISTWIAYEMSVIRQGFENLGVTGPETAGGASYQWLIESLPYRFYNYYLLWLVLVVVWLGRDWGPMVAAERKARAWQKAALAAERGQDQGTSVRRGSGHGGHWALAAVPLVVLVAGVLGGLFVDGGGWGGPLTWRRLIDVFGRADAAEVLVGATAAASAVAMGLTVWWRWGEQVGQSWEAYLHGMQTMFLPALILVFAWTLNGVIREMGTASYLVSWLGQWMTPGWLPAVVFLMGALISFSTGTSWGTMALLMPLAIPVAARLTGWEDGLAGGPVFLGTIGAVLAGAVFGDHCSPLSDTTIVSAFSSECEVMDHVRTQLPYAWVAGGLAVVLGYLPTGWHGSPWLTLPLGGVAVWAVVRYAGTPVEVS